MYSRNKIAIMSLVASILLFAIVALTACHRGDVESPAKPVLFIGSILSKSGPAAAYGSDAERGARLALEQLRRADLPFDIRFLSLDDKSDKTEAAKAARSLIDAEGVHAILGPATSPSALSVGKFAEERGIPMVGTSPTMDVVTASDTYDRKFVFRVCFNDSYQGKVLARFAREQSTTGRAAIVLDQTLPYSIGLARTFEERFEQLGGEVVHRENYSVKDTDYSALVDKVAGFDVELVFIPGWDENVGPMLKQAAGRWDHFKLLGGDGWSTHRLLELAGGQTGNSYALTHFVSDDPSSLVQQINREYQAAYGELPTAFAALGYDAMQLIVDAALRAESFSGPDLRASLAATDSLELVTGNIRFDKHRNPQKEAVLLRIEPDRFIFHQRIEP